MGVHKHGIGCTAIQVCSRGTMEGAEPIPAIGTQSVVVEDVTAAWPKPHIFLREEKYLRMTSCYLANVNNPIPPGLSRGAQVGVHAVTVLRNNRYGRVVLGMPSALGLGKNFERWAQMDLFFRQVGPKWAVRWISRVVPSTGINIAINMAIMAITTRSSTNVKPLRLSIKNNFVTGPGFFIIMSPSKKSGGRRRSPRKKDAYRPPRLKK